MSSSFIGGDGERGGDSVNMEYRRKPLQGVDLHHIADDGHVTVTNSRGGLSGIQCATVEQAQAWIDELYPDTQCASSREGIIDIANQRYEAYMSRTSQSEFDPAYSGVSNGITEDDFLASCVKRGIPISVGERYLAEKRRS